MIRAFARQLGSPKVVHRAGVRRSALKDATSDLRFGRKTMPGAFASGRVLCSAAVVALVATFFVASSSSATTNSTAKSPYRILYLAAVSGPVATSAAASIQAWKASVKVVNAAGGVDGHQAVLDVVNDQGDPTQAVSLLQSRLSSSQKYNLVVPGSESDEGLALVPLLTQNKILSIDDNPEPALTLGSKYPYNFETGPSNAANAQGLAQIIKSKGYKRVAVMYASDAYDTTEGQSVAKALANDHMTVPISLAYSATATNDTSEVQQVEATHPDALYFTSYGPSAGYELQAIQQLGWSVPIIGDPAVAVSNVPSLVNAQGRKNLNVIVFKTSLFIPPAQRSAAEKKMIAALLKIGPITEPLQIYGLVYDCLQVVAAGADQARSISSTAVARALEHLKKPAHPGWITFASYKFTPSNHQAASVGQFYGLTHSLTIDSDGLFGP
jgi:branched-chain amino acid transport system substrate-binding protein